MFVIKPYVNMNQRITRSFVTSVYIVSMLMAAGLYFPGYASGTTSADDSRCQTLKEVWGSKGWAKSQLMIVPTQSLSGSHLKVCAAHNGSTCCTTHMEKELLTQGRSTVDRVVSEKLNLLRESFVSRTVQYNKFCTELIDKAAVDLHQMFLKTYGILYERNAHIFSDLFRDLRAYYLGSDLDLEDVLDRFFSTLMQRMFILINPQYHFDERYLQCVIENVDDLKPFGDVPKKLSTQVKRAFVAARTFYQGLSIGKEALSSIARVSLTGQCHKAFTKMEYCAYCRGLVSVRPCDGYCMNIMRGCLAYHAELHDVWNSYIDALMKVAERLEGPFNIESVVDPMNVKISDAIMNFQENSAAVTSKIFQGCGQPSLDSRNKRSASNRHSYPDQIHTGREVYEWTPQDLPLPPGDSRDTRDTREPPITAAGTSISRLIPDIRERLGSAKNFWRDLPHTVCSTFAAPPAKSPEPPVNCWNGSDVASYSHTLVQDGLLQQSINPEVEIDVRNGNTVIDQQVLNLGMITGKLRHAHSGNSVDWVDTADDNTFSVGSGSGAGEDVEESGSGLNPDDNNFSFLWTTRWWGQPVEVVTRRPQHVEPPSRTKAPSINFSPGGDKHVSTDASHNAVCSCMVLCVLFIQLFVNL